MMDTVTVDEPAPVYTTKYSVAVDVGTSGVAWSYVARQREGVKVIVPPVHDVKVLRLERTSQVNRGKTPTAVLVDATKSDLALVSVGTDAEADFETAEMEGKAAR